jgi:hypothetical protein
VVHEPLSEAFLPLLLPLSPTLKRLPACCPCFQLPFFGNLYEEFGTLQLPATLRFNPSPAVQSQLQDLYQRCASDKPQARPSMLEVVQQLDDIINLLVAEGG